MHIHAGQSYIAVHTGNVVFVVSPSMQPGHEDCWECLVTRTNDRRLACRRHSWWCTFDEKSIEDACARFDRQPEGGLGWRRLA